MKKSPSDNQVSNPEKTQGYHSNNIGDSEITESLLKDSRQVNIIAFQYTQNKDRDNNQLSRQKDEGTISDEV